MLFADPLSTPPLSDACHSNVAFKLSSSSPPPLPVEMLSSSALCFTSPFTEICGERTIKISSLEGGVAAPCKKLFYVACLRYVHHVACA